MEIDTEAATAVMSDKVYREKFIDLPLKPIANSSVMAYDDHILDLIGCLCVGIEDQRLH